MSDRQEHVMQADMERRYCFTQQEFLILAGSLEIRQMYGFKPEEPVRTDEREVYQQLFKMTKKGFLEASEDGYLVTPEIREMFHYIKEADRVVTICSVDDSFPEKCVYPAEKTVLIESGGLQGKYYKCSYGTMPVICDQLFESGVLLAQNVADDLLYDAVPVSPMSMEDIRLTELVGQESDMGDAKTREKLKECGIRTILEMREVTDAAPVKRLFLVERPVYDVILVQKEDGMRIFRYSRQLLLEILEEWMKGGEAE
ncbi:MAG: hypothetical protein NC416_08935 [Eubacterium sp.]|nr:hypothetical protein [Eubacterium sp.]